MFFVVIPFSNGFADAALKKKAEMKSRSRTFIAFFGSSMLLRFVNGVILYVYSVNVIDIQPSR